MSKEREMIEKLCSFQMTYSDWLLLIADAEELLAQPEQEQEQEQEQEPVAWGVYDPDSDMLISIYGYKERPDKVLKERFEWVKLYTAPPKRESLSHEQYMKFFTDTYNSVNPITDFARAIEKAHGIGVDDESDT